MSIEYIDKENLNNHKIDKFENVFNQKLIRIDFCFMPIYVLPGT